MGETYFQPGQRFEFPLRVLKTPDERDALRLMVSGTPERGFACYYAGDESDIFALLQGLQAAFDQLTQMLAQNPDVGLAPAAQMPVSVTDACDRSDGMMRRAFARVLDIGVTLDVEEVAPGEPEKGGR